MIIIMKNTLDTKKKNRRVPRGVFELGIFIGIVLLALIMNSGLLRFVFFPKAVGTPASIVVQNGFPGDDVHIERFFMFSQGGVVTDDIFLPVLKDIQVLNPRMIRIDHIYDGYTVVKKTASGLVYDFSRLDRVVDAITATGSVPMLSLSYMPPAIARDGNILHVPETWDDWSQVVFQTISHYSGILGKNIPDIRYEVWNEPDHAQFGGWKPYGRKNYLDLYHHASLGAGRVTNAAKFYLGGPSTTALYKNWITALVKSGDRVDFLSFH